METIVKQILFYGSGIIFGLGITKISYRKTRVIKKNNKSMKLEKFPYSNDEFEENDKKYINDYLNCPIMMTPFISPVITKYGHTLELNTLIRHFENNDNCPITRNPLKYNDIRLNINVYNMIKFMVLKYRYNKNHPQNIIKNEELFE